MDAVDGMGHLHALTGGDSELPLLEPIARDDLDVLAGVLAVGLLGERRRVRCVDHHTASACAHGEQSRHRRGEAGPRVLGGLGTVAEQQSVRHLRPRRRATAP